MSAGVDPTGVHGAGIRGLTARPARLLIGAAGCAATAYALARFLDFDRLSRGFAAVPEQPGAVAGAALCYTLAFWLRAVAWRRLISSRPATGRLFSILQASLFANHLAPFKAGEVLRPLLLSRKGVPAFEAASTTVVARLLDFLALALIAAIALPSVSGSSELALALWLSSLVVLVACVATIVLRHGVLPSFLPPFLAAPTTRMRDSLRLIEARQVATAFPVVVASWLLEASVLLAGARLLGVELSLQTAFGATAFTVLLQVVHLTPGGLGVYETSMTSVLVLQGVPADDALTLAVLTHGLKFVYSFSVGAVFAGGELAGSFRRRASEAPSRASTFEVAVARCWNVVNEGKPFTVVFSLLIFVLVSLPHVTDISYWPRAALALAAVLPLMAAFWRFDFPLKLRAALWVYLGAFIVIFQSFSLPALGLVLALYLSFTVVLWGTVYYHLRIGTAWTNFLRFWRLVLENPDPTSGNFQEQIPKVLLLVFAFQYVASGVSSASFLTLEAFVAALTVSALLLHRWLFTWVPALPQPLTSLRARAPKRISRRVIVIAIDGCRADRLREAETPFIDSVRATGAEFTNVATAYPARTVTCFSSMLTGAPASVHGMRSNFVPSLRVKCESVFDVLRRARMKGRFVGIAHLIDAFGEDDVRSVTAVMHNDEIDHALVAQARQVLQDEDPELLVLQLLSVDQTGHARGSYRDEYLRKIEVTDAIIRDFLDWCEPRGYLKDTTLLLTSDHGQGIGIGGHGHMSPPEIHVPCILWGHGVLPGSSDEPRFVTDIADTICHYLGVPAPAQSVGAPLLVETAPTERPLVYVIPALNEEGSLGEVLGRIRRTAPAGARVVVVDDGSRDQTAAVAESLGAYVVRHQRNRGLGAALRTGLLTARQLNARAAVYLDADGEYDPAEALRLLEPIERGEADYVLGSRFKGSIEGMPLVRQAGNHCFSLLLSVACGRWISDGQTGMRAFSRRALDVAEIIHDYNYAQVLTMDLLHKGMRMQEVPATYRRRRRGKSFVSLRYLWRVPLAMAREMLAG